MSRYSLRSRAKDEYKLSEEAARAQVLELLEFYGIDVDAITEDERKRATESMLDALVRYFRLGFLEVVKAPTFKVVQHLQRAPGEVTTIEYTEIQGKHKIVMDSYDAKAFYKRAYALMGSLSGLGDDAMRLLRGVDLQVVEALGIVFLAA